jgi:hypothetical protein
MLTANPDVVNYMAVLCSIRPGHEDTCSSD